MRRWTMLVIPLLFGFSAAGLWLRALAAPGLPRGADEPGREVLDGARLDPRLLKALEGAQEGDRFAVLVEYPRAPALLAGITGEQAGARVVEQLRAAAESGAAPVVALAEGAGEAAGLRVFWSAPVVRLDASAELIAALSRLPGVVRIRPDLPLRIAMPSFRAGPSSAGRGAGGLIWNLDLIGLDLVQPGLGLDGSGVVVANLDTGVDWTHPALMPHYRGFNGGGPPQHPGNWHVSTGEAYPQPGDAIGHGTHTMGILVGDDGQGRRTGVAPGAQWIAVKMIDDQGVFYESWAHDAFEWILAPEGDPTLAPDVVNGSWGTGIYGDSRFQPDVQALRAAGIFPVFSAGNGGPLPTSLNSPGDYPESFTTGAVDESGLVTSFSGRGPSPSPWSEVKPEIAAPGVDVSSTVPGGAYLIADGTSMAAPHAAGVAALLLQADPALSPDDLETILLDSAVPLIAPTPNNDTGWGLLSAYAAAVRVTPHGVVRGDVLDEYGLPIPHPVVTATHISGSPVVVVRGDSLGAYNLALSPGTYNLAASGFAFAPGSVGWVQVRNALTSTVDFDLAGVPVGALVGTVLDDASGAPISATLALQGADYSRMTNALGGYALLLPQGTWTADVRSGGHRIGHVTVNISVSMTQTLDVRLPQAPSILLIDSGRWYYESHADYFRGALDALDYLYDLWDVRDPYGILSGVPDRPAESDLAPYDLVIWSAPSDSPGLIWASAAVSGYLSAGGHMLLSGQDVAYWDGGGSLFVLADYFPFFSGAWYDHEGLQVQADGVSGTALEGVSLTINHPDSAGGQVLLDSVDLRAPHTAIPGMLWTDGGLAGLLAGGCRPYRLAWSGFGLEGAGPLEERIELLDRWIEWAQTPPTLIDLSTSADPEPLIGAAGSTVTRTLSVFNSGTLTETFEVQVFQGDWPALLILPDGTPVSSEGELSLPGCSETAIAAAVDIPAGLPYDTEDQLSVRLSSTVSHSVSSTQTIDLKTPAPILLLDDGLWVWYGGRYADALDELGLSYDYVSTKGQTLQENILLRYPLVIWTTGQDWFYNLQPSERRMAMNYMQAGGRLLLSSQDLLDFAGTSILARNYLGVAGYSLGITPTLAVRQPSGLMGFEPLAWHLNYPFVNWSDAISAAPGAFPLLRDAGHNLLGVASVPSIAPGSRSMFFSFPLEALPPDALRDLLMDGTRWLGPFGGSRLETVLTSQAGERVPLTLTLALAMQAPVEGLQAELPLPPGLTAVPGSLTGGWTYRPGSNTLIWEGGLAPSRTVSLGAQVDLAPDLPPGSLLNLQAELRAPDLEQFAARAEIGVGTPRLSVFKTASPGPLILSAPVAAFTLTARNDGFAVVQAVMTDTLPGALQLLTDTLSADSGLVWTSGGFILWSGPVPPGEQVAVTYQAAALFPQDVGLAWNFAEVWDGRRLLGDWAAVFLPGTLYFPFIQR